MEEVIEKVSRLKLELDKNKHIINVKKLNQKIKEDKELLNLIKKYHENYNLEIKEQIVNHELFKKYKNEELEVNLIILKINNELKKVQGKSDCSKR